MLVLASDLRIFVSDDRDVFFAMGRRSVLIDIRSCLQSLGQQTVTRRYLDTSVLPDKIVGDYFQYWKDFNVELTDKSARR